MKADQLYRIGTIDCDGSEYVSDDVLDGLDMYQHLALQRGLWIVSGWATTTCKCGLSVTGTKAGRTRTVVALPVEDAATIEDELIHLAVAVGLLAPASHRDGLVAV
jgi:hypothetical protein